MLNFTPKEIANIIEGKFFQTNDFDDFKVNQIVTDSRTFFQKMLCSAVRQRIEIHAP